jgi:hypothetical protein
MQNLISAFELIDNSMSILILRVEDILKRTFEGMLKIGLLVVVCLKLYNLRFPLFVNELEKYLLKPASGN